MSTRWTLAMLLTLAGCECVAPPMVDAGGDAPECEGPSPLCTTLYGRCCEDTGFLATCVDGAWICDPCALGAWACGRPAIMLRDCEHTTREAAATDLSVREYCGMREE
ncbi:MAG: hypothetical protein J0L92_32180 [Deltaproteobacteria bacterium]|nr:hypothetical protein [Deltaproteobacteria bacterium]